MSGLLDRLGQANMVLQSIMTRSGESLTEIEQNLLRQSTDMQQYVEKIMFDTRQASDTLSSEAGALRVISQEVLADINQLTGGFGEKAARLQEATRAIDVANRLLETTITERARALAELTVQIGDRTETVDSLMRSFTSLIGDTLTAAEVRAREVGATLSAGAETAVRNVVGQLSTFRNLTAAESEKAAQELRQAQEAVIAEMARSVTETTLRFADATDKMREAARMMQTELDATRNELKRGVFELPREAEESTAALRKVVTDQLKALSELSSLAGKQNAAMDVSRSVVARSSGGRAVEAPVNDVRTAEPSRRGPTEPDQSSRRALVSSEPTPRGGRDANSERATREVAAGVDRALRGDAEASGQRGWVADLLKRASNDEPQTPSGSGHPARAERAPHHIVESLNSLSVDIARAIDDEAFLDLWERYKRGERNVFTRRLYTLPGQQTFEEIRRKYSRESEFRAAVDRYIDDFEQLLADVARTDRDNVMSQSYLTSDTGKVYTLLAHASGHLD